MTDPKASRAESPALQRNLDRLAPLLARLRTGGLPHLIDGATTPAAEGATFVNHSPIDGSPICEVARGTAADVDRAANAARKAFPGWRDLPASRRRDLLQAIADAIERRADDIAMLESWDSGQPIRYMSKAALRGAENFRFYADRAESAALIQMVIQGACMLWLVEPRGTLAGYTEDETRKVIQRLYPGERLE